MALSPLFDRVVVKELERSEVRKSGLHVPIDPADRLPPQRGIILAVGPGLDWWESQGVVMPVLPGDEVVFPYNAGSYIEVDEEKLLVLRVGEILGKLS